MVLMCWIAAHGGKLSVTALNGCAFDARRFRLRALNYLERQNVQGPLLIPTTGVDI